jgi:hypothetical protein
MGAGVVEELVEGVLIEGAIHLCLPACIILGMSMALVLALGRGEN